MNNKLYYIVVKKEKKRKTKQKQYIDCGTGNAFSKRKTRSGLLKRVRNAPKRVFVGKTRLRCRKRVSGVRNAFQMWETQRIHERKTHAKRERNSVQTCVKPTQKTQRKRHLCVL